MPYFKKVKVVRIDNELNDVVEAVFWARFGDNSTAEADRWIDDNESRYPGSIFRIDIKLVRMNHEQFERIRRRR
jgi:hypothetical protein